MIVLLDIQMPETDGVTLLKQLHEQYPRLCVIMTTAYGDPENIHAALDGGAHDFIVKPIDFTMLYLKLRKAARYMQECQHYEQPEKYSNSSCRKPFRSGRSTPPYFLRLRLWQR
jgi:adenylate cyclase